MRRSYAIMFMFFFVTLQLSARDFLDLRWDVPGDFEEPRWMKWAGFVFFSILIAFGIPGIVWDEAVKHNYCSKVTGTILTALIGVPLAVAGIYFVYHSMLG